MASCPRGQSESNNDESISSVSCSGKQKTKQGIQNLQNRGFYLAAIAITNRRPEFEQTIALTMAKMQLQRQNLPVVLHLEIIRYPESSLLL